MLKKIKLVKKFINFQAKNQSRLPVMKIKKKIQINRLLQLLKVLLLKLMTCQGHLKKNQKKIIKI